MYKKLEFIEQNCEVKSEDLKRKLQEVERGLQSIKLPLMYGAYVQDLFNAKSHVELVKSKLYRTALIFYFMTSARSGRVQ